MQLKTLRENRAKIGAEIRRMADTITGDKKDFNAEERANWDRVNKDYDSLGSQIAVAERADHVEKELASPNGEKPGLEDTGERRTDSKNGRRVLARAHELALQGWCLRQAGKPMGKEHKEACRAVGFDPRRREVVLGLPKRPTTDVRQIRAGLGVGSAGIGGALVPQGFVSQLELAMKSFSGVREAPVEVMRTETGNAMPWPSGTDTANVGELLGENTAVDDTDTKPTFSSTTFNAYKFSSKLVRVGYELLEDSAFDLAKTLGDMLGERIGRAQATYFTTGTGSSQPGGIVVGSTLGKTAASATVIASDEVIDLIHSVDPAYRKNPSVGFMMNDGILAVLRKLKDSQNRYLWEPSVQAGVPEKLLNYPIWVNQQMQATVVTATKTILFGDMSKYKVRDVNQIRLRRLDERFADTDQIGFIAFLRSDAKVLNAGGNPIKHLLQA